MKIVDAFWELRNLGKKTLEITFEPEDFKLTPKEIYQLIENLRVEYQAEYLVVKIRAGKPEFGNELCKHDFYHIETQLHLKAMRDDVEFALNKYARFFRNAKLIEATTSDDLNYIKSEIMKGIFHTDRIALDKNFGVDIANKRYANWVEDEFNRQSKLFFAVVGDKKIGFSLHRYENISTDVLLVALFKNFQNKGFGTKLYFAEVFHDYDEGYKNFCTAVSANNEVALKMNELFGYKIESVSDVYVKHYKY